MDELPKVTAQIDAYIKEGNRIVKVVRAVWTHITLKREAQRELEAARTIVGLDPEQPIAYRHDSTHSDFTPDNPHPDNLDALKTASALDIARAHAKQQLQIVDRSGAIDIEKSMLLLGSPTAEALSQLIFGYEPVPGSANGLALANPPVELPFVWQLDPAQIDPGAVATRFVRGHGWTRRPNWRVLDTRNGKPYIPHVDNNGLLASDILVVTKLPNFITVNAYDRGSFIVSFGGAHGTGTRAIELVLRDVRVLREMGRILGQDPVAYQALFRVHKLTHNEREGTRAHAIELIDVVPIEDTEERFRTASAIASPHIHTWIRRDPDDDIPTLL